MPNWKHVSGPKAKNFKSENEEAMKAPQADGESSGLEQMVNSLAYFLYKRQHWPKMFFPSTMVINQPFFFVKQISLTQRVPVVKIKVTGTENIVFLSLPSNWGPASLCVSINWRVMRERVQVTHKLDMLTLQQEQNAVSPDPSYWNTDGHKNFQVPSSQCKVFKSRRRLHDRKSVAYTQGFGGKPRNSWV